jgi:hypothetical protein
MLFRATAGLLLLAWRFENHINSALALTGGNLASFLPASKG